MATVLIPVFITACTFLIFLFPALLLYLVPVRFLLFVSQKEGHQKYSVSISWGVITYRIIQSGEGRRNEILIGEHALYSRQAAGKPHADESLDLPAPAGLQSVEGYLNLIPRLIEPAGRIGSVLYHESTFEDCAGSIRIGLKDPVVTGLLYGGFHAARFMLVASRMYIDMTPEFNREIFEVDMKSRFRINHPLRVLVAGLHLLTTPGVRKGMFSGRPPRTRGAPEV